MICYVLAMGKQHLGPHVVVGYSMKIFWPGLFITLPDHLVICGFLCCLYFLPLPPSLFPFVLSSMNYYLLKSSALSLNFQKRFRSYLKEIIV